MKKSKSNMEYFEELKTVETCWSNQEYIKESAMLFIESLNEERAAIKEEGGIVKEKSFKFIDKISDDGNTTSDFASCSIMFAKFFEIVGHLVSQNYSTIQKEACHEEIEELVLDLKAFNKEINKHVVLEKLKELAKLKNSYVKKQATYEKAIKTTEDALTKLEEVRNDPTLAYELSVKESCEEKANSSLKDLENKKRDLRIWIDRVNAEQHFCADLISSFKRKTIESINQYMNLMLNILLEDVTKLTDHFQWITLLSDEKGKQFNNAQKLKYFHSKKNTPINKLKDLRHSLMSSEADSLKKLKIYRESIRNIVNKERKEQEGNYGIVKLLWKYVDVIEQSKEGSNKRFTKILKMIKSKISHYQDDLPLIEYWDLLVKKYESMVKNNSLYLVFISNIKLKIDNTVNIYTNNTKGCFQDIVKISEEIKEEDGTTESEERYEASTEEIIEITNNLVSAIDLVTMAIEETYDQIEVFIKTLYSSLSALVAYEGTYIQQNEQLVKQQKTFLDSFDAESFWNRKNNELEESSKLISGIVEELDLIPVEEDDEVPENLKGFEGLHQIPYKSKEPVCLSETNSCPSHFSGNDFKTFRHYSDNLGIQKDSSGSQENSGDSPDDIKVVGLRRSSFDKQPQRMSLNVFKSATCLDTLRDSPFKKIKFDEIESKIINKGKEKLEETKQKDKKDVEGNLTSFEKKFTLEKEEILIDSYTCAVAKKILLHGRLYITNQRLCFHSVFNNKLLFFGKDTKLVIPLGDVTSLEKRINALVFDNSIAVMTK
jgi:hypothetical protein